MASGVLACDGELVSVQPEAGGGWRVDVGVFDSEQFTTTDSFLLSVPDQSCELIASQCVVDSTTGLRMPCLAFRANDGGPAPSKYSMGVLDTSERAFVSLQRFTIASAALAESIEVDICDGPMLCVLRTLANGGGLEITIAACDDLDGGAAGLRHALPTLLCSSLECHACSFPCA